MQSQLYGSIGREGKWKNQRNRRGEWGRKKEMARANDDIAEYQKKKGQDWKNIKKKIKTQKGECVNKQGKVEGGIKSDDHQELRESRRNLAKDLNKESESNVEKISK